MHLWRVQIYAPYKVLYTVVQRVSVKAWIISLPNKLKHPNYLRKLITWNLKSEIQVSGFRVNCEESNLVMVMYCWTVHNQVRELSPKEIHEDSRPGLDSPFPGKKSNRTQFKPEKSDLENSNLFYAAFLV